MTRPHVDIGDRVPEAEAVVAAAFRAFNDQAWEQLVVLTDRDSVIGLKQEYLKRKRMMANSHEPSAELLEMSDSDGAELFRQWLASRKAFSELAGVVTMEQAEALSPDEFLVRWAQARHCKYLPDGVSPWNETDTTGERVIIGSIATLPDVVAVMVRQVGVSGVGPLDGLELIAVLGDGTGDWRLNASNGWLGMADAYL